MTAYYRQWNNRNSAMHNRIACTDHLPDDARAHYAAYPRRQTFKRDHTISFHKLPAKYLTELRNRGADYVICDHCREQASSHE